jgi:hypothetical protein
MGERGSWFTGRRIVRRFVSLLGCVAAVALLGAGGAQTPKGEPAPSAGQAAQAAPRNSKPNWAGTHYQEGRSTVYQNGYKYGNQYTTAAFTGFVGAEFDCTSAANNHAGIAKPLSAGLDPGLREQPERPASAGDSGPSADNPNNPTT